MPAPQEGQAAPDFRIPASDGTTISLNDFHGKKNVVLYFYPKDNTPGCTTEACDFRDHHAAFESLDAVILGVSRDSEESHKKFIEKKELKIKLLSDEKVEIHEKYDVMHPKHFKGKDVISAVRTTFLINPEGKITKVWDNVKDAGHAEKVLLELKTLKEN